MLGPQGIGASVLATPAHAAGSSATVQAKREAKTRETATETEATFLGMLLKEMRQTLDDGLFPGDSGDVHGGLFDLYLGRHLAAAGGVGLAASLTPALTPSPSPAPPHGPAPLAPGRPAPRPAG